MKIGLNLLLWDTVITEKHVNVLERLAELGYDGVEIPLFAFNKGTSKKLRKHLDRLKLKCTVSSCVPMEANPISSEAPIRRKALNFMKKTIDNADIMGVETIMGPFTSPVGNLVGRPRTEDEWKWGVDVMRKVALEAEKTGVTLALEALNRFETYFINTVGDACKFAKEVDHKNFKVTWDTFHANIEEENLNKAITAAGDLIGHVHVSENHRGIPGTGHIPFAATFKTLKKIKYDGWLTIEAFSSALPEIAAATCIWRDVYETQDELAIKSLEFVKKTWDKAKA